MRLLLAYASLRQHPLRTALAILGVAVSSAMLLDMVMLATGMQRSFADLLTRQGFALRLAPKGSVPFDSEARIPRASQAESVLRAMPEVELVAPVLGSTVHLRRDGAATAAFALGIRPALQRDYEVIRGSDITRPDEIVANALLLRAVGAAVGDTVRVAAGYDPQLRRLQGERRFVVRGEARFRHLNAKQEAAALTLESLQSLGGAATADQVSMFLVRAPGDVGPLRRAIERAVPTVSAISTAEAVASLEQRVSYFRQLALILGAVSLAVGFLLVATLVTVSVQERLGEVAVMRAIGVHRTGIAMQVVLEGLGIALLGVGLGMGLGLVTARWLNDILRTFPGLPAAMNFFVFSADQAWRALGMLLVTAVAAGVIPAWRAASLPIAVTLRREAVG